MAKYLITVTETYRVDTETEAAKIIEEAKVDGKYVLSKYSSVNISDFMIFLLSAFINELFIFC